MLKIAKPINLKTWEVQAVLDDRKTSIRRVIKDKDIINGRLSPYHHDDILFVRETFLIDGVYGKDGIFGIICTYRADNREISIETKDWNKYTKWGKFFDKPGWCPSVHMPQDFARIFLQVTDVRVERLREITDADAIKEGFEGERCNHDFAEYVGGLFACTDCMNTGWIEPPTVGFAQLWDTTIKPSDRALYGWDVNPYVCVTEFKRIEAEE